MAKNTTKKAKSKDRVPWRIARENLAKIPETASRFELERELLAVLALVMADVQEHEFSELEFTALDLACNALDLASQASRVSAAASDEQIGRAKRAIDCLERGRPVRGKAAEVATLRGDALDAIHEVFTRPGFALPTEKPREGLAEQLLAQCEGRPTRGPRVSNARILAGAVAAVVDRERYARFGLTYCKLRTFQDLAQEVGELGIKDEPVALAQGVIDSWGKRGQWQAINALLACWKLALKEPKGRRVSGAKHPLASWYFPERKRRLGRRSGG